MHLTAWPRAATRPKSAWPRNPEAGVLALHTCNGCGQTLDNGSARIGYAGSA